MLLGFLAVEGWYSFSWNNSCYHISTSKTRDGERAGLRGLCSSNLTTFCFHKLPGGRIKFVFLGLLVIIYYMIKSCMPITVSSIDSKFP